MTRVAEPALALARPAPAPPSADAARDPDDPDDAPDAPLGDPLARWHARPANDDAQPAAHTFDALARRLERYLALHAQRAPQIAFARDALRRRDLDALGLRPLAHVTLDDARAAAQAVTLCEALERDPRRDEPWIERALREALGARGDPALLAFWLRAFAPTNNTHPCAPLRRTYALAALARLVSLGAAGSDPAERALCEQTHSSRADVRAAAATYLLAAYRHGGRSAPLRTVSALQQLARDEPHVAVRYVARSLLAADKLALEPEHLRGAVRFLVAPAPRAAKNTPAHPRDVAQLEVKGAHSLAHVHAALALAWALEPTAHHAFSLGENPAEFTFTLGGPRGPALGQVLVGDLALRERDVLVYAHARDGAPGAPRIVTALRLGVAAVIAELDDAARAQLPRLEGRPLFHATATARHGRNAAPPVTVLFRTHVNGTKFHDAPRVCETLAPGDWLKLTRERDNPYDERAVEVRTRHDDKLGYIPRDRNSTTAALLDAGERLGARLVELEGPGHAPYVLIDVMARLA